MHVQEEQEEERKDRGCTYALYAAAAIITIHPCVYVYDNCMVHNIVYRRGRGGLRRNMHQS